MNRIGPIYRHCTPVIYDIIKRVSAMPDVVVVDLRKVLIQGAVPTQQNVLDRHNNFQGGYRNTIEIVGQPHVGLARVSADHLGIEYVPITANYVGHIGFGYRIRNVQGQYSEVRCVHIYSGV